MLKMIGIEIEGDGVNPFFSLIGVGLGKGDIREKGKIFINSE